MSHFNWIQFYLLQCNKGMQIFFPVIIFVLLFRFMHAQIFCIYMLLVAFAYFLYLYADIRYHIYCSKNQFKDRIQRIQQIDEYIKKERCTDSGNQVLFIFYEITWNYTYTIYQTKKHQHEESFVLKTRFYEFWWPSSSVASAEAAAAMHRLIGKHPHHRRMHPIYKRCKH